MPPPLDPIASEVIAELISGAISSVVGRIGKQVVMTRSEAAAQAATEIAGLDSEHLAYRLNLAVSAEGILPPNAHSALRTFLKSAEMANTARQLCAAVFVGQEQSYADSITGSLATMLALNLTLDYKQAMDLANLLVEALAEGFRDAKRRAKDRSRLADDAWRELFLAHLRNIDRVAEGIASIHPGELNDIHRFEVALRNQVRQRHRLIVPPNIGENRRVSIDELYVTPQFVPIQAIRVKSANPVGGLDPSASYSMQRFSNTINRTVVLGSPGAGKTTLVTKICYDLAGRSEELRIAGRHPVPIPIVLRDFAAMRREQNISILDFITTYARTRLQLDVPATAFNYFLSTGAAVVLFDGLDELLDVNLRQHITADVESFCNWFTATPVLVTSRLVGYREAPLDESIFTSWKLADFDEPDVQRYVQKWYAVTSDAALAEQEAITSAFLRESSHIRDLRSNPLMLALLCNIYRGEGYLPRYRPDVYERCSMMLFERWDRSRGIPIPLSFEAHMASVLMSVAHWMYTVERSQDGVTEGALVEQATAYLYGRRFQQIELAEAAARDFVGYCRGRAWVLTDVGTTASGERLYQFTHRTFLEYFTAAHLVRINITPERVWRELRTHVAEGEWEVVASLAVQLLNRNAQDGADRIFRRLLADVTRAGFRRRNNLLEFAARCLQFIVPSPQMVEAITGETIKYMLYLYNYSGPVNGIPLSVLLDSLTVSAAENRDIIIDRLEMAVRECRGNSQNMTIDVMITLLAVLSILRLVTSEMMREDRWVAALASLVLPWPTGVVNSYVEKAKRVIIEYRRGLITIDELHDETVEIASHWANTPNE